MIHDSYDVSGSSQLTNDLHGIWHDCLIPLKVILIVIEDQIISSRFRRWNGDIIVCCDNIILHDNGYYLSEIHSDGSDPVIFE